MYNRYSYNRVPYNSQLGGAVIAVAAAMAGASSMSAVLSDAERVATAMTGHSSMTVAITRVQLVASVMTGHSSMTAAIGNKVFPRAAMVGHSSMTVAIKDAEFIVVAIVGNSNMRAKLYRPISQEINVGVWTPRTAEDAAWVAVGSESADWR